MSEMSKCYTAHPTLPLCTHLLFPCRLKAEKGFSSMKILTMIELFLAALNESLLAVCACLYIVTVYFYFSNSMYLEL